MERNTQEKRLQLDVYKPVYKTPDGDIYICEYIFMDYWPRHLDHGKASQGTPFAGATGVSVRPITQDEIRERAEDYDVDELWKMAVQDGHETRSLDEYREALEDSGELKELAVETYEGKAKHEFYKPASPVKLKGDDALEYGRAGRCFDFEEMLKLYNERPDGFELYDEGIFTAILAVERPDVEAVREIYAHAKINHAYARDEKTKKAEADTMRHAQGLIKAIDKKRK